VLLYTVAMSFIPGKVLKTFTTKSGRTATLQYPQWEMLSQLLDYINTLSKENTFIRFSGEEITLTEEAKYLASIHVEMELQQKVYVYCTVDGQLVGVCEVGKIAELKERGKHMARLGITVAKDFRGEGIGEELAKTTIEEAQRQIEGIRTIILECFAINTVALNLYRKLGFTEVGRIPGYLKHNEEYVDEVQMVLHLST
jgi:RimJ/RimL family protein N-acetyltransferase